MNIIELEAVKFAKREFFEGGYFATLENLSNKLSSKLFNIKRNEDKLQFLNILRSEVEKKKSEHLKVCNKPDKCSEIQEYETGIFVIDQEVDDISQFYEYIPKNNDELSPKEKSNLQSSINQLKSKLDELGYGQEILFEELDDLKNLMNLGKKNWVQLLKGKLLELTLSKVIEKSVVDVIYNALSDNFDNIKGIIE